MTENEKILANFESELRRGLTVLVTLSQCQQQVYGYQLVRTLADKGLPIEANTIYPLLRRLEEQGLLKSDWDTGTDKPRKYYLITFAGQQVLKEMTEHWLQSVQKVNLLLEGEGHERQ